MSLIVLNYKSNDCFTPLMDDFKDNNCTIIHLRTFEIFHWIVKFIEFKMIHPVWVFILNVCIIYCVHIIEYINDEPPSRNVSST